MIKVPGKLILMGEYAVTQGHWGLAIPAPQYLAPTPAIFTGSIDHNGPTGWRALPAASESQPSPHFFDHLRHLPRPTGTIRLTNRFGERLGLGTSSASFLVAWLISHQQSLLFTSTQFEQIFADYQMVFPKNSGIDLAVHYWQQPLLFRRQGAQPEVRVIKHIPKQLAGFFISSRTKVPTQQALLHSPKSFPWNDSLLEQLVGAILGQDTEALQQVIQFQNRWMSQQLPSPFWDQIKQLANVISRAADTPVEVKPLGAVGGDCLWVVGNISKTQIKNLSSGELRDYYCL